MKNTDCLWMQKAIDLAQKGIYTARPNPMVGAIVVKDGQALNPNWPSGWHQQAGTPHAEVHALQGLPYNLQDATLYVTLEPCGHQGRTPPCVDLILKHNIGRVVVASRDPNPLVAGKGIQKLRAAGVLVEVGILEQEARQQNIGFISRFTRQRPYVRAKMGMSLDGKIAMASGESQWITSPDARSAVQKWRAQSGLILTTRQTVLADDCLLNVRDKSILAQMPKGIDFLQPKRMVIDSDLMLSPESKMMRRGSHNDSDNTMGNTEGEVIVAVGANVSCDLQRNWLSRAFAKNIKCVSFPQDVHNSNHIDMDAVLQYLAETQINDVLIEAGPRFLSYLLDNHLVDELILHIAPDLLGAKTLAMQNIKIDQLSDKIMGEFHQVQSLGRDIQAQVLVSDYAKEMLKTEATNI